MCHDGTRSDARALRRTKHWQDSVHVEPIQHAMTRFRASFSFKTRKMSFAARLRPAMRDELIRNGWTRPSRSANEVTESLMAVMDDNFTESNIRNTLGGGRGVRRVFLCLNFSAIKAFTDWLVGYVLAESHSRHVTRTPKKLSTLRLHLVGRGKVGKSFPPGEHRNAAYQRTKSSALAKQLFQAVTLHATNCLPAFIIRDASGYPHRRTLDSLHSLVQLSHPISTSPTTQVHQPTPPAVCHFLRLPAEIRNLIYEYTLSDSDTNSNNEVNLLTAASPTPALPLTCKQIGEECGLMYLTNFKNFWRTSNFYIDSSALLTGWHLRPTLMQLPERELDKIQNLRVSFVAKNGVYNAVWEEGHWVLRRVGGPDPSGRGVMRRRLWGAEECVMIYRFPSGVSSDPRGSDYEIDAMPSTNVRRLAENKVMIDRLRFGRVPMRGQIFALIKEFHRWY